MIEVVNLEDGENKMVRVYEHIHALTMSKDPEQRAYGKCLKDLAPILERFIESGEDLDDIREMADMMIGGAKALATTSVNVAGMLPAKELSVMFLLILVTEIHKGVGQHPVLNRFSEMITSSMQMAAAGKGVRAQEILMKTINNSKEKM